MSNYRIIIKNIFSNWMSIGVSAAIGFFLMPFLVHQLDNTLYGIWVLIISLTGYGVLLDFGIRSSIVKYAAQYHATDDRVSLNSVFSTGLAIYLVTGIILMLTALVFAQFLPRFFNIVPQHMHEAKLAFLFISFSLALKFPAGVFEGFLCGIQRYDITNGISIFGAVLKAIAIVIFLGAGYRLAALGLIVMMTDIVANVLMVFFCFKYLPFLRPALKSVNRKMFKNIYRYGLYSFIIIIATKLIYESDAIIIGAFLPAQAITFYAIANNLIRYLRQISYGFGNVFSPAASEFDARNEHSRIQQLLTYGTKYSLLFILPVAFTLIFLGREFISIWMGSGYARESGDVLIVLTISQMIAMSQFSSGSILYGLNKHNYLAFFLFFEAIAKLVLSIGLIGKYGIIGVAWGTAIPEIAVYLFLIPWYITKAVKFSLITYLREAFYPPFLNIISFAGLLYIFKVYFQPVSWAVFMFEITIATIVYGITSLFICFNDQQRTAISGILVRRMRRASVIE
jgi:O-antigen/teichoic acid export membrane protein